MYNHSEIEKKWQDFWEKNKTFKTDCKDAINRISTKPKYYVLDMFPYPSGAGLHVGHPEGYTANDIVARYKNANGYNVLHPMGWDAFGLPAENYAIKTGTHPKVTTQKNIETFKKQIKALGFSYDWDREINTTDPEYFKWTQWIFLKMFEAGLAYEQDLPINYCPSCKTGLANEEVLTDNTCDRCGNNVEKKKIRQWVLAITKYADRLEKDVDKLDWPKGIKDMQKNWIGRSEGCEFEMKKFDGFYYSVPNEEEYEEILKIREETNLHTYNFSREQFVIAKKDGKLAGFIRCYEILGNIELGALYVKEEFRGEKLGYKLISYIIDSFDGKEFYMDCKKSLENYYKVFGFEILQEPKDFQLNKLREVYKFYGVYSSDDDILEKSIFMKFTKKSDLVEKIRVYTTRIDTVFGMTYAVIAPDHKDVNLFITPEQQNDCQKYIEKVKNESEQDRTNEGKEKTGVFTGSYVVNPYNNEKVPLWIADYVLGNYGTGAVMAVPAHDERDFEFAKKYDLEIKQSIGPNFSLNGNKKIRDGIETINRNTVSVIIKNKNKYILLQETGNNEIYFVGGGIDEGENEEIAIKREILEETGYKNIEIKDVILKNLFCEGFRITKQKNQKVKDSFYYAEIINDDKNEITEEELLKHNIIFLDEKEVGDKISWEHHKYVWDLFINGEKAFTEDGILVNSGEFDGLTSVEARKVLTEYAQKNGFGEKKVNYKLRDWLFSRQRYWGEPIPLIHLELEDLKKLPHIDNISKATDPNLAYILKREIREGENENNKTTCHGKVRELVIGGKVVSKIYDGLYTKIICDYNLPLKLPEVEKYEPAGDGQSPLANVENFVNVRLADNLTGKRETNTMPQWGGSCWYYLRFMDNENPLELVNNEVEKYWGQVDSYVGGAEHAVLHLLYARFWHKFLFDIGVVSYDEPFQKLRNQGLILAYAYQRANGGLVPNDEVEEINGKFIEKSTNEEVKQIVSKMSKSLKNVVNPDDIIAEYGADSLRLYEMYMSDFKDSAPWDSKNIIGVKRFLDKVWRLFNGTSEVKNNENDLKTMKLLNKTIKKVGEDIEEYKFNTAIAQMMILVNNGLPNDEELKKEWKQKFLVILSPFAPHIVEELWERFYCKDAINRISTDSIFFASWPKYDEKLVVDDTIIIGVQVLGKLRGEIEIGVDEEQTLVLEKAKANESVAKWLEGKDIIKEIYVKGKIVNIVVR